MSVHNFHSILENSETNQHVNVMLTDKESSIGYKSGPSDLNQGSTNDSCQAKHNDINLDNSCVIAVDSHESLAVAECDINTTSNISTMCQNADVVLVENSNGKINGIALGSQDRTNQRYILQDESRENSVISVPKVITKRQKLKYSATIDYRNGNGLCCKMSIVFAICCIIGCWLIPVILYYVSQATDRDNAETDPGYSHEKNISSAKVCGKSLITRNTFAYMHSYVTYTTVYIYS